MRKVSIIFSINDINLLLYSYTAKVLGAVKASDVPESDIQDSEKKEATKYYKVQLIDENAEGIDDCIKIVPDYKLK